MTAKTNSTNIRLRYGIGQVTLNWECNKNELIIFDPLLGFNRGIGGKGRIPENEFVHITWIIDHDYMLFLVNGEVRLFSEKEPYMGLKSAGITHFPEYMVGVAAAWGSVVTVKELSVTKWRHADNGSTPLALLIDKHKVTVPQGESFTLESRVFPDTVQNQRVTWSTDNDDFKIGDHRERRRGLLHFVVHCCS